MKLNLSPQKSAEAPVDKMKLLQTIAMQTLAFESNKLDVQYLDPKEIMIQKKSVLHAEGESGLGIQKTQKIKKNKRKQKKKGVSLPSELLNNKKITKEVCQCCSGKIDSALTHDGFQSQDQSQSEGLCQITDIIQRIFSQSFDKLNKIVNILKNNEVKPTTILIKLMEKLAILYQDIRDEFEEHIYTYIGQAEQLSIENQFCLHQQYHKFIVRQFPLLKDFITYFKLSDLKGAEEQAIAEIRSRSSLIESIFDHMEQIAAKRIKKKIKKQQKKLNKQEQQKIKNNRKNTIVIKQEVTEQIMEIAQKIKNIIIEQKQRSTCYLNEEWWSKIKLKYSAELS